MALFNDPVRAQLDYQGTGLQPEPVLVMGWEEVGGRYLLCMPDGTSQMADISVVTFEWRWVSDRGQYPNAKEYDRVADNWAQKVGPGWLDRAEMQLEEPE